MNQKSLDKLSLCQNGCYCMTKTIKGLCGKCGEMKSLDKNKTKEPVDSKLNKTRSTGKSKELNSNYGESAINKPKELDYGKKSVEELLPIMGDAYKDLSVQVAYKEGYNRAISLLLQQKERIIDELKNIEIGESEGWDLAKKFNCCPGDDMADAYNQALKDVINLLEKSEI